MRIAVAEDAADAEGVDVVVVAAVVVVVVATNEGKILPLRKCDSKSERVVAAVVAAVVVAAVAE